MDRTDWITGALVVGLAAVLFARAVGYPFLELDDAKHIFKNPLLNPPSWDGIAEFWSKPYFSLYIPLTYTFWSIVAWVGRLFSPTAPLLPTWIFHALNVTVHATNAFLVYRLLSRIPFADFRLPRAAARIGAVLFLLHPVQVESVCWIACFKDQFCGFFSLLSLLAYAESLGASGPERRRAYLFSFAAFLAACLAKPTAVILPAMAWAMAWGTVPVPTRASVRKAISPLMPWFAISAALVLFTNAAQPPLFGFTPAPLLWRPGIVWDTVGFYTGQVIAPLHLLLDYGRTPARVHAQSDFAWFWGLPPLLAYAAWRWRRHAPTRLAIVWFLIPILPVSGLIAFNYQLFSTVSDRYLYLSMIGPAVLVAFAWSKLAKFEHRTSVVALLALLGIKTIAQVGLWRDSETIFRHSLAGFPDSIILMTNLSAVVMESGRFAEGVPLLERVVQMKPDEPAFQFALASALAQIHQFDRAQAAVRAALEKAPQAVAGWNLLGSILADTGHFAEARSALEKAVALDPRNVEANEKLRRLASVPQ